MTREAHFELLGKGMSKVGRQQFKLYNSGSNAPPKSQVSGSTRKMKAVGSGTDMTRNTFALFSSQERPVKTPGEFTGFRVDTMPIHQIMSSVDKRAKPSKTAGGSQTEFEMPQMPSS